MNSLVPTTRNEIIFVEGNQHFDSLIKDINEAIESVDLETYIFQKDSLGQLIIQALNKCYSPRRPGTCFG